MKKLILAIAFFIPTMCMAHMLHIENLEIPLYAEKVTTPSLNIMIGAQVFYAPLVPRFIPGTVHVAPDNEDIIYSTPVINHGCVGENTRVGHYFFVGDCLVGADDNVYLESTGTQYIDTTWTDTNETAVDAKFYVIEPSNDYLYGSFQKASNKRYVHNGLYIRNAVEYNYSTNYVVNSDNYVILSQMITGDTITIDFNGTILTGDVGVALNKPMYLMALPPQPNSPNVRIYQGNFRTYYFKIKDGSDVVRHFIPVPAGMVIGNYTVSSNGMWDIVEQRFYGNSGTGDFIYGVDQ